MSKSRRQARLESFVDPTETVVVIPFSGDLVECAFSQLRLAFDTRLSGRVVVMPDNHYSPHTLGSIVLLVSALESWLNEMVWIMYVEDKSMRKVANEGIVAKFGALSKEALGDEMLIDPEMRLAVDVRNEIVHCLPGRDMPSWLEPLSESRIMIKAQNAINVDFTLHQKLSSYRLAVWCWYVVTRNVRQLCDALSESTRDHVKFVAASKQDIFSQYLGREIVWWVENDLTPPSYDFALTLSSED